MTWDGEGGRHFGLALCALPGLGGSAVAWPIDAAFTKQEKRVEGGMRSQEVAGCAGRKRSNLAGGERPSPERVGISLRPVDVADLSSGRCKHPCLGCAATRPKSSHL
jgi:hypothetical protein